MAFEFETEPCSRCYGSGSYSFNSITGSRCFRCGGAGKTLTKVGSKVWHADREARTVTDPSTLQPGDRILIDGVAKFTIAENLGPQYAGIKRVDKETGEHVPVTQPAFISRDGKKYFAHVKPRRILPADHPHWQAMKDLQDSLIAKRRPKRKAVENIELIDRDDRDF